MKDAISFAVFVGGFLFLWAGVCGLAAAATLSVIGGNYVSAAWFLLAFIPVLLVSGYMIQLGLKLMD